LIVDLDLHLSSFLSFLQRTSLSVLSSGHFHLMRSFVSLVTFVSFASELITFVGLLNLVSISLSESGVLNSSLFFGQSFLNNGDRLLFLVVHGHIFEQIFNHYKFDYFSSHE
jgi:hypothetical protein